jgi:cytidylate kinase
MNIVQLSSFQRDKNRMNMIKFVDLTDSSNSGKFYKLYTIDVHCWKIYNLFVRALETSIKVSLCLALLVCFAVSANQLYI